MSLLQGSVILIFVVACVAQEDFSIDCKTDAVLIKWPLKLTQEQLHNPYTVLLGNCVPSTVNGEEVVFHVAYDDCLFKSMVFGNKVAFVNLLTYRPGLNVPAQSHMVECVFDKPALDNSSAGKLDFSGEGSMFTMELMNDDFSGPSTSSTFSVGSKIHVRASVTESTTVPQQVYLDECIMTSSPNPYLANDSYTVVNNAGCLLESKYGNATLQFREKPSELRFCLMAVGFVDAKEVYLHCRLISWEKHVQDVDKKACSYSKERQRWELLDDSSRNDLCSCCDSICQRGARGQWQNAVVGPIKILSDTNQSSKSSLWNKVKGSSGATFWLLTVFLPVVLLAATGALALSYYLCWWRGGRMGYRPARDLLNNKY
ncbi:uncharacterized protein LOC134458074 isoform X2 [Engraulis encrasicolus]|uniref:uncharacterized protein LOC134458074 isoform X2 n=1 Tax=Engraulis encrasicolus TaxID=184585 RepID=UPI002FD7496A